MGDRQPPSATLPEQLSDAELALVIEILERRPTWEELASALEEQSRLQASDGLKMLGVAFGYDLLDADQVSQRARAGGAYQPAWSDQRPADVVPEVVALWRKALAAFSDPIITARLADLLYVLDGRAGHADGRLGAHAHLALAGDTGLSAIDRARIMHRALEVLAELNDREALAAAATAAVEMCDELLGQEHAGPPFIVLRGLLALKPRSRPDDLDALMDRVIERFADDPGHNDTALGFAERVASEPSRVHTLRRRRLAARVDFARTAEGLRRVHGLQRALALAQDYGFSPEAQALLRELQDIPHEALGFESFQTSVEVPVEEINEVVDHYVGTQATDIIDALGRFGSIDPPGGSNADVDAEVARMRAEHPLLGIFGTQVFGGETSSPMFIANSESSKQRYERGKYRRMQTGYYGSVLLARMLIAAIEHHGRPTCEQLAEYFVTPFIPAERANRFARAFELFWDKDFDSSAHVLVPRLEATIRDLARKCGIPIVTPPQEGVFAGLIPLSRLLAKLRDLNPDDEWLDYLEALLCEPLADNLRNEIAHGLRPAIGGADAALLLHAACHLALLRPANENA
jgi:hypothetical protein